MGYYNQVIPYNAKEANFMLTKADELRQCLDTLEADLGKLGFGLGPQALEIPTLMDQAAQLFDEFRQEGRDLAEERLRWETASHQLRSKASTWLREVGGSESFEKTRRARQPSAEAWWWFLDKQVTQDQKRSLRRTLKWAVGAALVLVLLGLGYKLFLAPDPGTQARIGYTYDAESLSRSGDLTGALQLVEKALATAPDDPDLLIFKGVLQNVLGQTAAAEESFQKAEKILNNQENFYLLRAQRYFYVGHYQEMLADTQAVIQVNTQSATGYMLQGQAQEALGNSKEAMDAYERASQLAEANNQPEIAVTARMLYGTLLQRQGMPTIETQP